MQAFNLDKGNLGMHIAPLALASLAFHNRSTPTREGGTGPEIISKRDKQDSSRSGQTSLATAGRDFTKPVKLILGPVERGNAGTIHMREQDARTSGAGAAPPLFLISPWECPLSLLSHALF